MQWDNSDCEKVCNAPCIVQCALCIQCSEDLFDSAQCDAVTAIQVHWRAAMSLTVLSSAVHPPTSPQKLRLLLFIHQTPTATLVLCTWYHSVLLPSNPFMCHQAKTANSEFQFQFISPPCVCVFTEKTGKMWTQSTLWRIVLLIHVCTLCTQWKTVVHVHTEHKNLWRKALHPPPTEHTEEKHNNLWRKPPTLIHPPDRRSYLTLLLPNLFSHL